MTKVWTQLSLVAMAAVVLARIASGLNQDEKSLHRSLMDNYDKLGTEGRPRLNNSDEPTAVSLSFYLIQIQDFDRHRQVLTLTGMVKMSWEDPLLRWNSSVFGEVDNLSLDSEDVWTPDVVLYNSISTARNVHPAHLWVVPAGEVVWVQEKQWDILCETQVEDPSSTCDLRFGSWSIPSDQLTLKIPQDRLNASYYTQNSIYELGISSTDEVETEFPFRQGEFYSEVNISFTLTKRPGPTQNTSVEISPNTKKESTPSPCVDPKPCVQASHSSSVNMSHTTDEKRLYQHLMAHYGRIGLEGRPQMNPMTVSLGFYLIQIQDLDQHKQVLTLTGMVKLVWTDPFLTWNQSEFGEMEHVSLNSDNVWTPDVVLYNSISNARIVHPARLWVTSDGEVTWVRQIQWDVWCETYIEEETPYCELRFGSWSMPSALLSLKKRQEQLDANYYKANHVYELGKTKTVEVETEFPFRGGEHYGEVKVSFGLKKRPPKIDESQLDKESAGLVITAGHMTVAMLAVACIWHS